MAKRLKISIPAFSNTETGITDINLSRLKQRAVLFRMSEVQLLAFNDAVQQEKYISDLEISTVKLKDCGKEIIELQKKVIALYEEFRNVQVPTV